LIRQTLSQLALLGACIVLTRTAQAQEGGPLPLQRQASILARALTYDANLLQRANGEVTLLVLYRPSDAADQKISEDVERAFRALASIKILGLALRVLRQPFTTADALSRYTKAEAVDAYYVCPGLDRNLTEIKGLSRKNAVLTMGSRQEQLTSGLSLGVFYLDGKSTIVVNVAASREEGAAFGSDLLRLAKVIK
jgi:hypothetical protein